MKLQKPRELDKPKNESQGPQNKVTIKRLKAQQKSEVQIKIMESKSKHTNGGDAGGDTGGNTTEHHGETDRG